MAVLRFGRVSVEDPTVTLGRYQPLISRLGEVLGRNIELVQTPSYKEMQNLFLSGQVHLGILNALSYVRMGREASLVPVAKRMVGAEGSYRSYIIVHQHLPVSSLDDLRGRSFAFSEEDSTTGYLLPMHMLRNRWIEPERDFSKILTINQHDSIILAVANRSVDAAAVASYVFDNYDRRITEKTRILAKSAAIPLGPLVIRKDLGEELAEKMRDFFLQLDQQQSGRQLLHDAGLSSFSPVTDGEYDNIREALDRFEEGGPGR
jgi:phosphonate transport system substrate-binding protein